MLTKLRWLACNEPANTARVAAVCLPHDWVLTWRLMGPGPGGDVTGLEAPVPDRSDASGTAHYSTADGRYLPEILTSSLGSVPMQPRVLAPLEAAGRTPQS